MINLLDNAVKYSPPGSTIEITARAENREAILEIADSGPGIPPGEGERIFEKFYRAPEVRGEGSGLGLAVCRAIARAHGGRITAETRPGGGAVFRVILPRDETGSAAQLPEEELTPESQA